MSTIAEPGGSELFLVRVWPGRDGASNPKWAGRLQHVVSGESHAFRGCDELLKALAAMLSTTEGEIEVCEGLVRQRGDSTGRETER